MITPNGSPNSAADLSSRTAVSSTVAWSKLGLGTGNLASFGRAASLAQVNQLLEFMLESGITVIDTADTYGSGDCEILLGKALRGKRDTFALITKAGYRHANLCGPLRPLNQFIKKGLQRLGKRQLFKPEYLEKALNASLSRLKTRWVDAFLLHDPPLNVVTDKTVLRVCADLQNSGKTRLCGVSSDNPKILSAAILSGKFQVIQTPANLKVASLLQPLWQECEARGIHVIGNHIFDSVCLATAGVSHEKLMRGSSALLPAGSTILCGTRNPAHLKQVNEWVDEPLSVNEAQQLAALL